VALPGQRRGGVGMMRKPCCKRALAALGLVVVARKLHQYRPTWPPRWLSALGDYLTTAAAGALDVVAFLIVLTVPAA
jgi:hypothetical protein